MIFSDQKKLSVLLTPVQLCTCALALSTPMTLLCGGRVYIMKPTGSLSRLDQAELPSPHIWAFVLHFGTAEMTEPSFNPSQLLLTGQVGG